jgi:hypothetical protein
VTDNGLVLVILLPQSEEIPAVPVNVGFDGSESPGRRSRDSKRRDERIFRYSQPDKELKIIVFSPFVLHCINEVLRLLTS